MTFTTVQGSGANDATSYVGSSGVDSITITNAAAGTYLTANASGDFISYNTTFLEPNVLTGAVWYGGQGADTFVDLGSGNANANFVLLTNSVIYANKDADTIGTTGAGITAVTSSIYGGQGNDAINLLNVSSSMVQGNKDTDTITLNGTVYSTTSIYGGAGGDTVTLGGANNESITNTLISLDNDNDSLNFTGAVASFTGSSILGGQGNDTINGTNAAASLLIDGGEGNNTLTGDTQADTITAGAGNDSITGGAAADRITTGAGQDTVAQIQGNSFAITASSVAAGTAFAAGQVLTFGNGIDVISDFSATADRLDTTVAAVSITAIGVNDNALVASRNYALSGTWNATAGSFTVAANSGGPDTLFFATTGVAATQDITTNTSFAVLTGVANNVGLVVI